MITNICNKSHGNKTTRWQHLVKTVFLGPIVNVVPDL